MSEVSVRYSPTYVVSLSNNYTGEPVKSYIITYDEEAKENKALPLEYNTNLKHYNLTTKVDDMDVYQGLGPKYPSLYLENTEAEGLIVGLQSYENSMMCHYWVPVPKGMWYIYNGEVKRVPANGLYDLLTGEFVRGYEYGDDLNDYGIEWPPKDSSHRTIHENVNGQNVIFKRNQKPDLNKGFDYFDDWSYNTTDIDYLVKLIEDVDTHQ